jgi:hypothetical protein
MVQVGESAGEEPLSPIWTREEQLDTTPALSKHSSLGHRAEMTHNVRVILDMTYDLLTESTDPRLHADLLVFVPVGSPALPRAVIGIAIMTCFEFPTSFQTRGALPTLGITTVDRAQTYKIKSIRFIMNRLNWPLHSFWELRS